ncbi:MAG: hypothetical protein ACK4WH_02025 [Phycisphaerales bacterium]
MSGLLESPDNNPANDYAVIGTADIGCINHDGAVWIEGWNSVNIGSLFGDVHVPSIPDNRMIRVARQLGDPDAPIHLFGALAGARCECVQWTIGACFEEVDCASFMSEATPRNPQFPWCDGFSNRRGRIWIRRDLAGQIIINGDNGPHTPAADYWTGGVQVGLDNANADCPGYIIANDSDDPDTAPYYSRLSSGPSGLGGGAVGLAPFHLHGQDCTPPLGDDNGLPQASFNNQTDVRAVFYGPIRRNNPAQGWASHVRIFCRPFATFSQPESCVWFDLTSSFDVFGPGVGSTGIDARSLRLRPKPGVYAGPGVYRLSPAAADSVRCEHVTGRPPVVWPTVCVFDDTGEEPLYLDLPGFEFIVSGDCDHDDVLDHQDPDLSGCSSDCAIADFNGSGAVTVQDIFDFLTAYFNRCGSPEIPAPACGRSADVNDSGGITVQDIFDFLAAYFNAGNCGPH